MVEGVSHFMRSRKVYKKQREGKEREGRREGGREGRTERWERANITTKNLQPSTKYHLLSFCHLLIACQILTL